jgi:hypothetical protein
MNSPKYIIIAQLFENDRTIFRLKNLKTFDCIEKTADAISLNIDIINSLSSTDAHLIGFVSASEKTFSDIIKIRL